MKITVATAGTKGDLYPYLSIAIELKQRGHSIIFASSPHYKSIVEKYNLYFKELRPDLDYKDPHFANSIMSNSNGGEFVMKQIVDRYIQDTYLDLLEASKGSDLIIASMLCFAAPIVSQKTKIPWISGVIAPSIFWSKYDPIVPHNMPFLRHLNFLGKNANNLLIKMAKKSTLNWFPGIANLRNELGLRNDNNHPMFEGAHSPLLTLGLYSEHFAKTRPDYPESVRLTGFVFLEETVDKYAEKAMSNFIESGTSPIVFTLGSSAAYCGEDFYKYARIACEDLNERAIFLMPESDVDLEIMSNDNFYYVGHYPHSKLFKYAKIIVHHGGIGTLSRTLMSGCPSLVVPFSHDQPDNAYRLERLSSGIVIELKKLTPRLLKQQLRYLLNSEKHKKNSIALKNKIILEKGAKNAADFIEEVL